MFDQLIHTIINYLNYFRPSMNKDAVIEHINQINLSIVELNKTNDMGAIVLAHNDLIYYEHLLTTFD